MTGTLILLVFMALLVTALEVTQRRTTRHWRPGSDLRFDRDVARIDDELRAVEQADPAPEPYRVTPPGSAETDARLVTRVAA